jgi:hypothetical protein
MPGMRAVPAVLGLLVTIAITVTGCHSSSTPQAGAASHPASSATAPASSPPSAGAPVTPTSVTSPSATSSAASSPGGFQDLAVPAAVRSELIAAFAAAKGIPVADVPGTTPGSVHYGYDAATATYWAEAGFRLATRVPLSVQVGFQDGASTGFFKKAGSGAWQVTVAHQPVNCDELRFFPKAVLAAWSLPASPGPSC